MDRIEHFRELIIKAITESYHYRFPIDAPHVDTIFLCDKEKDCYMLYQTGWLEQKSVNDVVIMARIKEDKIWIDEDWTQEGIATDLLRWGISPSDIIFGFHPPRLREEPRALAYS